MKGRLLILSTFIFLCLSCTEGDAEVLNDSASQVEVGLTRKIVQTEWDTLFHVESGVNDTSLIKPRKIVVINEHIFVVDVGDQTVLAFDTAGKAKWRFGGIGGGPKEFKNIVDIEVDEFENIWVSDGGLSRITTLSPEGIKRSSFSTYVVPRHIAVFDSSSVVTTVVSEDEFFVTLDSLGKVETRFPIPLQRYKDAHPTSVQMFTSKSPSGRLWALASPFASRFFVYDGLSNSPVCTNNQIEVPDEVQPSVQGKVPKVWMYAMSVSDSMLYLLARGNTAKVRETVDVYSLFDCKYLHSYILPRQVVSFAVQRDKFFTTYEDSTTGPGILALKRVR